MHVPINVKSPNNISEWQMGFNSAFKGLTYLSRLSGCPKSSQRDAPSSGISLFGTKSNQQVLNLANWRTRLLEQMQKSESTGLEIGVSGPRSRLLSSRNIVVPWHWRNFSPGSFPLPGRRGFVSFGARACSPNFRRALTEHTKMKYLLQIDECLTLKTNILFGRLPWYGLLK